MFFLFLFFSLFFVSLPVNSQTTIKEKPAQQWHCLQNVYCASKGANCTTKGEAGKSPVMGHRVKLTTRATDLPAKNQPTGVFVCLGTKQGNICTSGNGAFDKKMLGYDGLAKLGEVAKYEFQGLFRSSDGSRIDPSSIVANNNGKLSVKIGNKFEVIEPIEMQDYTPAVLPRKWLALNLISPQSIKVAGKGGEQQGTFTFEGALGKCTAISWDPYGIVFDSQSLEPVSGVKVSLYKKRPDGSFTLAIDDDIPSILNPVITFEDGQYEMYVPDGIYRLKVEKDGFVFPSKLKLNPNYSKIYSDIYRGEDIIEQGKTEHRDIPIDSKTIPFRGPIKIIAYAPLLDKGTNTMIIQGKVSHPLTEVKVYGRKPSAEKTGEFIRTRLLTSLTTDNLGEFDLRYQMNKLEPTEMIGDIEFIKSEYFGNQKDAPVVIKNDTLSVEPILNHLEGYAYDQNGRPLSKAKVAVYLDLSTDSAYETMTDENGFYRISSEFLPPMNYYIKYFKPDGTAISVTTSKFIAQNAKYLEAQQENLFKFKDVKGRTLSSIPENNFIEKKRDKFSAGNISNNQLNQQLKNEEIKDKNKKNLSNILPIVVILIFLGIGLVVTVVYFIKRNKTE